MIGFMPPLVRVEIEIRSASDVMMTVRKDAWKS